MKDVHIRIKLKKNNCVLYCCGGKMKAVMAGQDYTLMLEKDKQELENLREKPLEASLMEAWTTKDLGKKVSLEFGETDQADGIEVRYVPEHQGWEAIQKIRVTVNQHAYDHILQRGHFGTRYGLGDKIDIINGDPREIRRR